jgi:glycosyltransferase involved in cell wall biosynthesis
VLFCARTLRSVDWTICGHCNLIAVAAPVAAITGSRLALVIHGVEAWERAAFLTRHLVQRVDCVISVSRLSAERFAAWSGLSIDKFFILPNAVDVSAFVPAPPDRSLKERYNIGKGPVILTLGRMETGRHKGFQEVIEALPQLALAFPDIKYLMVGDGTDRPRLEAVARAAGVGDHVIFAGRIADAEKAAHYNLADVYAMPSRGEGFGIVLIEAAACGLPIVGSAVDGSREALLNGTLGRLVDPAKPDEIFDAIATALKERRPHVRHSAVANFTPLRFETRVAEWVGTWDSG